MKRGIFSNIINTGVLIANVLIAIGLIISAYSGYISPAKWKYAPLAVMTFAGWYVAIIAVFIIDLIWWKRSAVVAGLAIIACAQQIWDFSPLNLPRAGMSEEQRSRSFSIMTYNVMQFVNQDPHRGLSTNEQIDYILYTEPDIVCIEEARCFVKNVNTNIIQEQIDDLASIYKYMYTKGEDLGLLSKFDTEPLPIDLKSEAGDGSMKAWKMDIHGTETTLFVVHLESYRFSVAEKSLFEEATTVEGTNRKTIKEAKSDLLPKVTEATSIRDRQIEQLIVAINDFGGENVIVCGDFNDTVGCYGLYRLKEMCGLKEVYPEVGFGPMVTYDAYNFIFRIDHILYRGDFTPYSISKGDIKASDHYPVTATILTE